MAILNTAISGLLASQRSLSTVSHNISNVNTEGYSRQRVELSAREAQRVGPGYIGSGVLTSSVQRISDQFLISQLRTSTTASSETDAFMAFASRLDNMLADAETGLNPSMENFFSAIQDVNDLPSSSTARQVMLSEGQSLAERFQFLDDRLNALGNEIKNKLNDDISNINNIANSIADINSRIVEATGIAHGNPPNDLLDQRDQLVLDMSEIVAVNTVAQNDGSINVFIGKGQPLVVGINASALGIAETYEGHYEVTLTDKFFSSQITESISSGSLGAAINFQNTMLEPARNELGRLAIGLAETFNDQHRLGISLDGDVDTPFFTVGAATVAALNGAPINITAAITDISKLTDSDYNLVSNGDNTFTLTRLDDQTVTTINTGGSYPYTSAAIDGFELTITAAGSAGDQYVVRPTVNGASDLSVLISDPRKLAIASPLKAAEATDAAGISTNLGDARITDPAISRTNGVAMIGVPLATDINLTFTAPVAAVATDAGASGAFNDVNLGGGQSYSLTVGGVGIFSQTGVATVTAGDIDTGLATNSAALTSAGISYSGSATSGTMQFTRADGTAFDIDIVNDSAANGFGNANYSTGTNTINNGSIAVAGSFDYTSPAPGGSLAYDPATENAGKSFTINLNANESTTFTISGFPQDGDAFVIENNVAAAGDNRNGLLLGQLQQTRFLNNGSSSYQDAYGQMVAEIGARTRQTEISSEALSVLREQALEAKESVSGVNLDEEAANMLKFQQSYSAAAQMISVADNLFQSLMNAFR